MTQLTVEEFKRRKAAEKRRARNRANAFANCLITAIGTDDCDALYRIGTRDFGSKLSTAGKPEQVFFRDLITRNAYKGEVAAELTCSELAANRRTRSAQKSINSVAWLQCTLHVLCAIRAKSGRRVKRTIFNGLN